MTDRHAQEHGLAVPAGHVSHAGVGGLTSAAAHVGTQVLGYRLAAGMRLERKRANLLTLTATSQELSALVAAARMALEAMRSRPSAVPADALELLERVLADYDRGCARLGDAAADSRGAKSASGASGSLSD